MAAELTAALGAVSWKRVQRPFSSLPPSEGTLLSSTESLWQVGMGFWALTGQTPGCRPAACILHDCSLLSFQHPFPTSVGTSGPSPSLPHPLAKAGVPAPLQIQLALVPQIPPPDTQGLKRDRQAGHCLLNTHPDFSQDYCQFSVGSGKLG